MYIYGLRRSNQNTLLFRDIETGRAQMKGIRISNAMIIYGLG